MSCNTKTSLAAVIDAVNAQLNNNYVDRDDPRINQGVFTEPTIRGGLMLDEAAKLDFCGYVTECGQREPFGKQWVDRPLYPHNTLVSYEDGGEVKSRWQDIDAVVAGTEIGEAYTAYEETRSLGLQGYTIIDSFELGETITQRNQALRHAATGKLYRWAGDLPKIVPAGSTPDSSGGVDTNAWLEVSDMALRQEILTGGLLTDKFFLSVKDFDAKGDGITNDTASIVEAAKSNKAVYFPSGEYLMDAADYEIYGSSIDFFGNGDATIVLRNVVGGRAAFKLGGDTSASIEGINVTTTSSGWLRLFVKDPNQSVDDITVHKCKFYGKAMLFLLEGNALVSPLVDFCGVNKISITQNLFQDMYTNAVHLKDCPVRNFQFERNKAYNFLTSIVYLGIDNSNPYGVDIKKSTWKVSVKNNEFINDDSTYARAGVTYHCCLLVECENVYWEGNHVEGLKSLLADSVVYDAYLTATNIVHKNNVIKNICSFHPDSGYRVLIKGKSSSVGLRRTKKIIEGNTYTIEKDWVDRVGDGNTAEHYLYQLNDQGSGGDTVIKSNIFNIQGYIQTYDGTFDNLSFIDNEITAEYFVTNSPRKCFFNALPTKDEGFVGSMHIKRNKWKFGTLNNLNISVYEQTSGITRYWKYVDISDNTFESLEANKPTGKTAMFMLYKADETLFANNTFINTTFDTVIRTSEMGVFTTKNNNFSNDYYLLSGLDPFELLTKVLWARGIKAPVNVDLNILAKYNEKSMSFYLPKEASNWGLEDRTIAVGEYALKVDMASGLVPSSTLIDFKFSVKNEGGVLTLNFLEYVPAVDEVPASTSTKNIVLNDGSFAAPVDVASSTLPNTKIGTLGVNSDGIYFEPKPIYRTICNLDIKLKIDKFPSTHTGI